MTLEQLVTDLATSQRLKDAGFPQDTALVWMVVEIGEQNPMPPVVTQNPHMESMYPIVAAPTAGELEEWLRTKYPDATISSFRREGFGMDADIDDDTIDYHNGVGMYPTLIAALAALVLEVAG